MRLAASKGKGNGSKWQDHSRSFEQQTWCLCWSFQKGLQLHSCMKFHFHLPPAKPYLDLRSTKPAHLFWFIASSCLLGSQTRCLCVETGRRRELAWQRGFLSALWLDFCWDLSFSTNSAYGRHMENGPLSSIIYRSKMAMFGSYVKLPDGKPTEVTSPMVWWIMWDTVMEGFDTPPAHKHEENSLSWETSLPSHLWLSWNHLYLPFQPKWKSPKNVLNPMV